MPKLKRKKKQRTVPAVELVTPTPEQMEKGDAQRGTVTHVETQTHSIAHKVHHDPVKRWHKDKKLTDLQLSTIERMQTLWHKAYGAQRLTGAYGEHIPGHDMPDGQKHAQIAAMDELRVIEAVFEGVKQWYMVFERICRFDLSPAEVCGSRDVDRERALTTVCFVADFIDAKGV